MPTLNDLADHVAHLLIERQPDVLIDPIQWDDLREHCAMAVLDALADVLTNMVASRLLEARHHALETMPIEGNA